MLFQHLSNDACADTTEGEAARQIPLAIMTSDATHAATQALLHKHSNFGMADDQVRARASVQ